MIAVCDISALDRWREPRLIRRLGEPVPSPGVLTAPSARSLSSQEVSDILAAAHLCALPERPLHVLVSSPDLRVRDKRIVTRVWSGVLPEGAFYQLTPEVLLASPSFCMQQMSVRPGLVHAVSVGMEICGRYAKSPSSKYGFWSRPPLETPESLLRHLEQEHGYGARRAREALVYVIPGARSPMETVLVLILILPIELGGCGLPRPLVNTRIEIPPALQVATGKPYLVPDLCWPGQLLILEYDSYLFHANPNRRSEDISRNEGLRDAGWMVRSVTKGLLDNDQTRWQLLSKVAERLGQSLPSDEEYRLRQKLLYEELLKG